MFTLLKPDVVAPQLQIRCHKIAPGTKLEGWLCGKLVVAVVHWNGEASKPCPYVMSGGALTCDCQTKPVKTRKIAYVPLITVEGERVAVIVSNGVAASMIYLLHGTPITLSRSRVPKSPLSFAAWDIPPSQKQRSVNMHKSYPVDIRPWLLNLWDHAALRRYWEPADKASVLADLNKDFLPVERGDRMPPLPAPAAPGATAEPASAPKRKSRAKPKA